MTMQAYKENQSQFHSAMVDVFAQRSPYYILHETANLLEDQAKNAERDRNGRPLTPARAKLMLEEARRIRNLARELA